MPLAGNDNKHHDQRQRRSECAGHHVIEGSALSRQDPKQQRDESHEQNGKPAEENKRALGFDGHNIIVR